MAKKHESQDEAFVKGEADRWFGRNKEKLLAVRSEPGKDIILSLLESAGAKPKHALEIGAANGYRLESLRKRYGCACTAVEPSADAILDGKARYPEVEFLHGVASSLPAKDAQFDLVIANFLFHWIGRDSLLRSVAEMDRCLADGGLLAIGDFFPGRPTKVRYAPAEGRELWTYKQDYSKIFLSSMMYSQVAAVHGCFDKEDNYVIGAPQDSYSSFAVFLLRKDSEGLYSEWKKP